MFTIQDLRELKALTDREVDERTIGLARQERVVTERLLLHMKEVEVRRIYLNHPKCESLHAYAIRVLKMSEGSAGRRVNAARLLKDFPELGERIVEGTTNLSKLSLMQVYVKAEEKRVGHKVTREFKRGLLAQIENKPIYEAELALAQAMPEAKPAHESKRVRPNGNVERLIDCDPELNALIEEVRALNSHDPGFADVTGLLRALCKEHLERHHPAYKKPRKSRADKTPAGGRVIESSLALSEVATKPLAFEALAASEVPEGNAREKSASPMPHPDSAAELPRVMRERRKRHSVATDHALWKRAGSQCEHVDASGVRCTRKFHLQKDHIIPWSFGGSDALENLQLLCRPHNLKKGTRIRERTLIYVA